MIYFSIITATYNAEAVLPRLLESLAAQTCRDFEVIIQDGASTDSTVAIAESWRSKLPHLSLVSEKDRGIYDAWNKAIERVQGEWVLFLGADDMLAENDVLRKAFELLRLLPENIDFAAGHGHLVLPDGTLQTEIFADLSQISERIEYGCPFCHASLFYNKKLFINANFNTNFKIAADYDFICQYLNIERIIILDFIVTHMLVGGISTSPATRWLMIKETVLIAKNRLGYYPREMSILGLKSLIKHYLYNLFGEERGNFLYNILQKINKLTKINHTDCK